MGLPPTAAEGSLWVLPGLLWKGEVAPRAGSLPCVIILLEGSSSSVCSHPFCWVCAQMDSPLSSPGV